MEPSPDNFEVVAGRGFFRPVGHVSLDEAIDLVNGAIAHTRASGITKLFVNGALLTGFDSPSLSERYFLVEKWARTASGAVRMALVVQPHMIDPQKFGVTVAINRRLIADVFVTEASAIAWLDSGAPPAFPCTG
ncbi:MAG: hypothetical protein H7Z43_11595 [Clostridia bacterium]|nr:hypothetical protein [Deltaproteobacteria bacterium]